MKFPKLKLSPRLMRMASMVVDLHPPQEGEHGSPNPRMIEYSFVVEKLARHPAGKVLDIGCNAGMNVPLGYLLLAGWEVHGIDLLEFQFGHPNFHFERGDIMNTDYPDNFFDHIYEVSTFEHIGMAGRYGVLRNDMEGDIKAMKEVFRILKPGGSFLLTEAFGERERLVKPWGRIYSTSRLMRLAEDFTILDKVFWARDSNEYWRQCSEEWAAKQGDDNYYWAIVLLQVTPKKQLNNGSDE